LAGDPLAANHSTNNGIHSLLRVNTEVLTTFSLLSFQQWNDTNVEELIVPKVTNPEVNILVFMTTTW
jgi:hypothetical protein